MNWKQSHIRIRKKLHAFIDNRTSDRRFRGAKTVLDHTLPFALLLLTFLIVFQYAITVTPQLQQWITWANWVVVGYFASRLVVDFKLADPDEPFLREHWLDILMIIPLFSIAKELRGVKLIEEAAQESKLLAEAGDSIAATSALRNSKVAAKITRSIRLLKRSL